jgi:hypothetical protein
MLYQVRDEKEIIWEHVGNDISRRNSGKTNPLANARWEQTDLSSQDRDVGVSYFN